MAIHAIKTAVPAAAVHPARGLLFSVRVRLAAPRLDARLAAGEDPSADAALAYRSTRLMSRRLRRKIAHGIERVCRQRPGRPVFTAAIPVDARAVEIARPALEQLAIALRSRETVRAQGVALAQALVTEPASALYRPERPDQLYEVARDALLALGADGAQERE